MKFRILVLICCAVVSLGILISFLLNDMEIRSVDGPDNIDSEAAEGSMEDPYARARYNWQRLCDPVTGDIPRMMGSKEMVFIQKLKKSTGGLEQSVSERWMKRGPYHIGGRTKALAFDVRDENVILAGGVSSGMWKSIDGGETWKKTTAPDQIHSVSCIVQNKSPGQEDIWYYGTGEYGGGRGGSAAGPLGSNASYRGDGIFKSKDGGETWSQLSSTAFGSADETNIFDFVWKILAFDQDRLLAATSRGLFKSMNGGENWEQVFNFGNNYPSTEIAQINSNLFYAAVGGAGTWNGVYSSEDGEKWENITPPDWPDTTVRTVIAPVPSNKNAVYFYTCREYWYTQLRKYDRKTGWTDLTEYLPAKGELINYGGNMLIFYVKPDDENILFLGTVGMYRSMDGGKSWEVIGAYSHFHVDQHAIIFYPSDPKAMIVGNDGGLFRTRDNTADIFTDEKTGEKRIEWESLNRGYLTTQFYTVAIDHNTPGSKLVAGGMQDNGCMLTESTDLNIPWRELNSGDGGFVQVSNGGRTIYSNQGGVHRVWRYNLDSEGLGFAIVTPEATVGGGLWLPPFILDKQNDKIMYLAWRTELWRNSDLTAIPEVFPALPTALNWQKLENVTGQYISAFGMSSALPRRLYYASNRGELLKLENPHEGQPVPVNLTNGVFLGKGYLHCIAVDPFDPDKLLIVFPNYNTLSIFYSENGGEHFIPVSGNLEEYPDGSGDGPSVRWVDVLYVGKQPVYFAATSVGLFSTTKLDSMETIWVQEGAEEIGSCVIDMVVTRQSDGYVAVGSHGNGVYTTTIKEIPVSVNENPFPPSEYFLSEVYPNPFNSFARFTLSVQRNQVVKIDIYNQLGQAVRRIFDGYLQSGQEHDFRIDGDELPSGSYYLIISGTTFHETRKMILIK